MCLVLSFSDEMTAPLRSLLEFDIVKPYDPCCGLCAKQEIDAEAAGYCEQCGHYLCFLCVDQHKKQMESILHTILEGTDMPSKSELREMQKTNLGSPPFSQHSFQRGSLHSHDSYQTGSVYTSQDSIPTGSSMLSSYTESLLSHDLASLSENRLSTDLSPVEKEVRWPESPSIFASTSSQYSPTENHQPVFSFGNVHRKRTVQLIGEYDIRFPGEKNKCWVWASLVLPNGDIVLCDNENNNIKLFDSSSHCKSVLRSESYPVDLCHSNIHLSEIYATVSGGVHHISANSELKIIRTLPVEGFSNGITCWKHGIAITVSSNQLNNEVFKLLDFQLHLLDYDGKVLKKIHYDTYDMFHMSDPWYLATIKQGQQVLISDWGTNCITCIDVDKGVQYVFKDHELNGPRGMAIDEYDNIFIVGWLSENVVQLSPDGRKMGTILSETDGLYGPVSVAYDKNKTAIMLQDNKYTDTMQIYQLT